MARRSRAVEEGAQRAPAKSGQDHVVTTIRIRREQWKALREEALRLSFDAGGRADASEVLRRILDEWMERG